MAKINKFIILGDVHIGSRNASTILAEHQIHFFENELFPYMKKHGITTILQLGDLFDTRKYTNHGILHEWDKRVFQYLSDNNITLITLIGNHDSFSRNTLKVNSTSLFLSKYNNIIIVDTPREIEISGVNFLIVPWVCSENDEQVSDIVKKSSASFCAGHFQFDGFNMQKGVLSHGGAPIEEYAQFDIVFSGHYHTKSKDKNILYVGTPFEQTWADYDDPKGFHVFDVSKLKASFIKNPSTLFIKAEYDDLDNDPISPKNIGGAYVKVIVINKNDPYKFEKYITSILSQTPADLKITEFSDDFDDVDIEDDLKLEDTNTLMIKFVDQCETDLDKDRLKLILSRVYLSALEVCE